MARLTSGHMKAVATPGHRAVIQLLYAKAWGEAAARAPGCDPAEWTLMDNALVALIKAVPVDAGPEAWAAAAAVMAAAGRLTASLKLWDQELVGLAARKQAIDNIVESGKKHIQLSVQLVGAENETSRANTRIRSLKERVETFQEAAEAKLDHLISGLFSRLLLHLQQDSGQADCLLHLLLDLLHLLINYFEILPL